MYIYKINMEKKNKKNVEGVVINEIKKHDILYDLSHKQYKNNNLKLKIWLKIAAVVGISKEECQKIWKGLKQKFKCALKKKKRKIDSGSTKKMKLYSEWLLKEMSFLEKFIFNSEISASKLSVEKGISSSLQLFDGFASDVGNANNTEFQNSISSISLSTTQPVNIKTEFSSSTSISSPPITQISSDERDISLYASYSTELKSKRMATEERINNYLDKLDHFEKLITAPEEQIDPFILLIDKELKKIPKEKVNSIKLDLLKIIYDAQIGN